MATDSITGNSFIMVTHESLYYGKKLDQSLINPNQLRCYETMVWDNPFDPYRYLCIETGDGNTIDLTTDGTYIGFISHVSTDKDLRTLPHIEVTLGSEQNPNTVKLGKVSMDKMMICLNYNNMSLFIRLYIQGNDHIQTIVLNEGVLHSINPAWVEFGANLKRNISEINTPANDEIPVRRTFVSHARHLEASAELISDLWCIGIKRA